MVVSTQRRLNGKAWEQIRELEIIYAIVGPHRGKAGVVSWDESIIWSDIELKKKDWENSFIIFEVQAANAFWRNDVIGSVTLQRMVYMDSL